MLSRDDYLSIVFQRGDEVIVYVSCPEEFDGKKLGGIINIKNRKTGDHVDFYYNIKKDGKGFEIKDYDIDIKTTEGPLFNVLEKLAKEAISKLEDVYTVLKPIKPKEAQVREDIPNKVRPINKEKDEEEKDEEEKDEEEKDEEDVARRINDLVKDVAKLKEVLKAYLFSSYKLTVSEDELRDLTSKVLDLIASFVSDLTTERIREFAEDELKVEEKK